MPFLKLLRFASLLTASVAAQVAPDPVLVTLPGVASGQTVTAQLGQQIRLSLEQNGTTGYQWQLGGTCAPLLDLKSDQTIPASGLLGAPSTRTWVFVGHQKGRCEIRLRDARPWEPASTGKKLRFAVIIRGAQ